MAVVGMICFGVGWLLCLTGVGALLGIPAVVIGGAMILFCPIIGPIYGARQARRAAAATVMGPCPYCAAQITATPYDSAATEYAFVCPLYTQRVIYRRGRFLTIAASTTTLSPADGSAPSAGPATPKQAFPGAR